MAILTVYIIENQKMPIFVPFLRVNTSLLTTYLASLENTVKATSRALQ